MTRSRIASAVILIGFVFVSLNTRVPFGQVGPLAPVAGIDAATITLLGVIPPLGMGISAPFAPWLLRRSSDERLLFMASLVALGGALLRPLGITGLVAGTCLAALAIGVVNVLIPVYVRRRFAGASAGPVFGAYALAMGGGSAVAASVVVPIAHATGRWEPAIATAILPALLAVGGSLMMTARGATKDAGAFMPHTPAPRVGRTWLAWSLMAFFGVQTLLFYALLAWLPSVLTSSGATVTQAGQAQALLIVGIALGGFASPLLAAGRPSQTSVMTIIVGLCTVGMLGLALLPGVSWWVWVSLFGLGLGGGQALPAVLCAHRGSSPQHTAALSSFAQTGGFFVAATGPILLSMLHTAFSGWATPLVILAAGCTLNLTVSWRAGQSHASGPVDSMKSRTDRSER